MMQTRDGVVLHRADEIVCSIYRTPAPRRFWGKW